MKVRGARLSVSRRGRLNRSTALALPSKVVKGDDGVRRPYVGRIESYDEEHGLYKVVYEDGDVEELTHDDALSVLAAPVDCSDVGNKEVRRALINDDREPC